MWVRCFAEKIENKTAHLRTYRIGPVQDAGLSQTGSLPEGFSFRDHVPTKGLWVRDDVNLRRRLLFLMTM